ncbi:hypothetical protein HYS00_05600 [Candidatus Microgenomates bacterium]|nr:hypothetical protein [Candidatus Microgenomates bacterium]
MAKPKRRHVSSQSESKHPLTSRRVWLFIISIVLIGLMVWQVIMTLGASTNATFNKRGVCTPHNSKDGGRGWGGFSICEVGKENSCEDSCSCVPFREGFKYGRCVSKSDITPTPSPTLAPFPTTVPGSAACGQVCETDSDCESGYCHDPNWQACPTETPEPSYTPEPTVAHQPTSTPRPTKIPQPTHACGVRGSSLVATVKVCRDRACFDGEQCACPVPSITLVPVTPTIVPGEPTSTPPPVCTPPVCQNGSIKKCNKTNGCPGSCGVICTSRKSRE